MTDNTMNAPEKGRKPDMGAYNVNNANNGKAYWNKVGVAWSHKDGQGFDIDLHSVPVNGRVVLRAMRDQQMQQYNEQQQQLAQDNPQQQQDYTQAQGYEQ